MGYKSFIAIIVALTLGHTVTAQPTPKVDGTLWKADGNMGVIFSHGAAYDADSWENQGEALAKHDIVGFAVEETAEKDVIKAAKMLKADFNVDKIALIGASAGSEAVIQAAQNTEPAIDQVILLSPVKAPTAITEIPVFVIYSEDEGFDQLENTIDQDEHSNIETMALPGDAHAQAIFKEKAQGEKAMKKIIDVLKEK